MRLDTSQQMRTEMRLRMAPRMIQSMEILQLPILALQERIDQELTENPLLVDLRDSALPRVDDDNNPEPTPEPPQPEPEPFDGYEEWAESFSEMHRPSRAALMEQSDRKQDAMQNMVCRPTSFREELENQLSFFELDAQVLALATYIIYNLDDTGYLKLSLDEIVRDCGGEAMYAQAEEALRIVQKLDPPGIGARDLPECLRLQLTPETPHRDLLETLITRHLEDLRQNRLPAIEKKTGVSIDTIKEALEQLRKLDPRPGARQDDDRTAYVLPDLIVEPDEEGVYQIRLVDERTPQLAISRRYQRMLKNQTADADTKLFLQKKLQAARWLIESIEQRRNTLQKVARAIMGHQKAFLDRGPEFLEPLKMQQIADEVKVHVTTVSRAVDDKWVQTPRGIFPLKRFFGGGTKTTDGEDVAWETIKQKLLEIIAKEDKNSPLSDEEIVEELSQSGFPVARRTVTKYRKALKIPSSRQRRQF